MQQEGIVQFYIRSKGYGYIRVDATHEEFHFRERHVLSEIEDGDKVCFEIGEDMDGFFAKNIQKVQILSEDNS